MSSYRPATTISTLPDNVFVEIFSFCRTGQVAHIAPNHLPWKWHRLAHVCRKWRHIMFASSRHLRLELLCTYGTPVRKTLGYLPTFPIVISYCGRDLQCGDHDNLLAALENHDRVRVVELGVPRTLFERLAAVMQKPFPALTHLRFVPEAYVTMPSVLPDTFLGGFAPRLQTIHISGIPFPSAPTLLSSAHDLVEVEFSDIPLAGYISPKAMVASLGALPRLKYLTFEFECETPYSDQIRLPIIRTIFPALTRFYFEGHFKYFENFVAQIDAPQLDCLRIEYLEPVVTDFQIPQLCEFLNRSDNFKPTQFIHADIFIMPADAIAIELDNRSRSSFYFSVPQEAIGQVASHFSAMLSNVDRLFITSEFEDAGDSIPWLVLFHLFTSVKALSIHNEVSWNIHLALNNVTDGAAEVLPALELLCPKDEPAESMEEFVREFVTARQNVGRPVTVVDEDEFEERLKLLDVTE
ncbi:hypothetical protein EDB89DRAFT_2232211 [Lactarius sanguifluus]|nr:hypothetical protein EDB89DRAFT_2232211 [Lactarius sanguifluus]